MRPFRNHRSAELERAEVVPGPHDVVRRACGWLALSDAGPTPRRAEGDLSFDMAVVGAGFTGLACARRLATLYPEASIALIDAARIGAGNSGRNSGFLLDISFYDDAPPDIQMARTRLQEGGLAELSRVVAEQGIDCDWQPWGNLYGAVTGADETRLRSLAERYRACGKVPEDWTAERMATVTGSHRFRHGLFHPGTVLVQPVKLIRGLAASLPGNVEIFEESPVTGFKRRAGGFRLTTAESRIAVERLFLCANGGVPALGLGKNRLLKVTTFAAMTGPLDGDEGPLGAAAPFGILPSLSGGATLRLTVDRRLIVRQGAAFTPRGTPRESAVRRFLGEARQSLAFYWPALADTPFAFAWGGVMALTRNNAQLFGAPEPGLFVAAFCNGAGNTAGTMAGRLLAELSAGEESELLGLQHGLPHPSRLPPTLLLRPIVEQRIAEAEQARERLYAAAIEDRASQP